MKLWYLSATAVAALLVAVSAEEVAPVTEEMIENPAVRLRGSEESYVHRKLPVTIYDAYDAEIDSKSEKETTNHNPGFTGAGGVDMTHHDGGYCKWYNVNGGTGGVAALTFRYSLGKNEKRYQDLYINNSYKGYVTFTSTGSFGSFSYKQISGIGLQAGKVNTIKMVNTRGNGGPTLDYVQVDYTLDDPNPKCYEECDFSSECTEGCGLCRFYNGNDRCMPKCGEPCSSDSHCKYAGGCSDCRSGRCQKPQPVERIVDSGHRQLGPHLPGQTFYDIKGGMCPSGMTRTKVTTRHGGGGGSCGFHGWASSNPRDCSVWIRFTESCCMVTGCCRWYIYAK